ncbi:MAG: error-prone DNA polymerase [Pseudomonadota bacterium]|nr:error-prone DNA polymerase [Pseudomonadota bacterium]
MTLCERPAVCERHAVCERPEVCKQTPAYAELHCLSNFSFQRGASSAHELVERAKMLGYHALAITDECSMAGIVRAWQAARECAFKLIIGTEISLQEGVRLVLLATNHDGYTDLCQLITQARRRSAKGEYSACLDDLKNLGSGVLCLWLPAATHLWEQREPRCSESMAHRQIAAHAAPTTATVLRSCFGERLWIAVELHRDGCDALHLANMQALSALSHIPLVASGDVHMHLRRRRALQDVINAIRLGCTVAEAGTRLLPNSERCLRTREDLATLYPHPLLAESLHIADRCTFQLEQLRYQYPRELVPEGLSATAHLRAITVAAAALRWPAAIPQPVHRQIEKELDLIGELGYESYFLTVHDIVRYARSQGILCQGRGSAANSAVCFALGITEVNPEDGNLLFERFISRERNEPPDIDVDFEHERREQVIQYIYTKYGRERAALTATVICYRGKSAIRDVGKAIGLSLDQVEAIAGSLSWWDGIRDIDDRLLEHGFDPAAPQIRRLLRLVRELLGFPRHLSQHVGGFVISEHALSSLVPVENAAMPDRTIIQWDKDDLDALGLLKVDVLALGMLTCIRRCFDLIEGLRGWRWQLAAIPHGDAATYSMIQKADTVGAFQIESRAQMSMLPRLRPKKFYDLVIQVAIVRPGPIQGNMVHPYLRRRNGDEPVEYPNQALRAVLERTLGIPIFQEQVMKLVIVAADFTPGEADHLRRSMAAWKRHGGLEHLQARIFEGMQKNGYSQAFSEQIFEQIKGFGSYGFPESHAASFALLAYASSWLKCHEPAAFACALFNSQPMGFYSNGQIMQDARRHGIEVLPVDIRFSNWDSSLERTPRSNPAHQPMHADAALRQQPTAQPAVGPLPQPAIRLGLREIRGMREAPGLRIMSARAHAAFDSLQDLTERADLDRFDLDRLAEGGALRALGGHRHRARWQVHGVERMPEVLTGSVIHESAIQLRPPDAAADVQYDYAALGYTLGAHPLKLLRGVLTRKRALRGDELLARANGAQVRSAGLVTMRQRPSTASGVTFVTLEDESGWINVVVWSHVYERQRRVLLESRLLAIDGEVQKAEGVTHLIAHRLHNWNELLDQLDTRSRDFR